MLCMVRQALTSCYGALRLIMALLNILGYNSASSVEIDGHDGPILVRYVDEMC